MLTPLIRCRFKLDEVAVLNVLHLVAKAVHRISSNLQFFSFSSANGLMM